MAKRKKRKHRPSAKYLLFASKSKPKSIIPTITKQPTKSADYKQIRDEIRKALSEQKQVKIEAPSKTYTSNRKKNRKEARQRRKEKKQKAKQQQRQQQEQPKQEVPQQIVDIDGDMVDIETGEILDFDDTENYIDTLQAEIEQVHQMILDDYSFDIHINERFTSLDRAYYWLDEAKQLPYDAKQTLISKLEQSVHLEEVTSILSYRYYTEMENASDDLASTIQAVIEDFL